MPMKLQFDANQQFQLDAVAAITDLFDGQPQGAPEFAVINVGDYGGLLAGQDRTELGAGNRLLLADDKLLANARAIQLQNDIEAADEEAPLEAWELFDVPADAPRACPHFSVEMETGTGKTYVYLRTIFELSQRYGFQKFVIVVPSVAIREGVLKNIEITAEHFRALYNNLPFEHFVYDARRVNRLRQFATSTTLQILIINIDAFRKNFVGTDDERKSNVIYKESDRLSGRQPIEFVQAPGPSSSSTSRRASTPPTRRRRPSARSTRSARCATRPRTAIRTTSCTDSTPCAPSSSSSSSRSSWPAPWPRAPPTTPSCASSASTTRTASRPSCASRCSRPAGPRRSRSR